MQIDVPGILGRLSWLFYLVAALLLYLLGVGMAQYLGKQVQGSVYVFGQLWVLSLVLFTYFSYKYFDFRAAAENLGRKMFNFLPWRTAMLIGILAFATCTASITYSLFLSGVVTQELWLLMLLGVAGACVLSMPPLRWATTGYGDLLLSFMVAAGIPAMGFILAYGGYHPYLAMIAFPLSALHIAMSIALSLPRYAAQQKYGITTLLVRLGWENGMTAHNMLILGALLLIAVSTLFNFPRFAVLPTLLMFPLGLLEVYYMLRIAAGVKPNWNALAISAVTLFTLPVYLLSLAFWTH